MSAKIDFGFGIRDGRQIDLDLADHTIALELDEVVAAWNSCISCGSCAATCPAGISLRIIQHQVRLTTLNWPDQKISNGNEQPDNLGLSALKTCYLCGKCQLVCPRGIPTRYVAIQIMQKIRRHAEGIPSV